jgi:hypothetical protein
LYDPEAGRARDWKAALFDNAEHRLIIRKHIGSKDVDASGLREGREMFK